MTPESDGSTVVGRGRWLAKKAARVSLAAGSLPFQGLRARLSSQPRVRVLTYHGFGRIERDPFTVTPEAFTAQLEPLCAAGLVISLAEFESFLAGDGCPREGSVLITIDDALGSVYEHAFPVLRRLNVPAVVFAITDRTADGTASPCEGVCPGVPMSWDQLRELRDHGVSVQSHSCSHRSMARLDGAQMRAEALGSREAIERELGVEVTAFAYPYGTRADYSAATASALREAGYRCAFTSQHGAVASHCDPLEIPRVKIEGGDPAWVSAGASRGALDAWAVVDRFFWKLQQGGAA